MPKLATFWATWKLKIIAGVAILAALAIAIYAAHHIGYQKGENLSKVAIERYQKEVTALQNKVLVKQNEVNNEVAVEYIKSVAYQDKIIYKNRDIIKTVFVERPASENITQGLVYVYNQSALGNNLDPQQTANTAVSAYSEKDLGLSVNDNFGTCRQTREQLVALQDWIRKTQEVRDEIVD